MTDPRRLTAHFAGADYPGEIAALEGNRGHLRVRLDSQAQAALPAQGDEGELEMHDGARFRVVVVEQLPGSEYRLKLLGRGAGA